ncbi:uncharacterized protein J3R85_004224 [Psidium guajava]|nr:uncharacterized protein J3R85_004224 [Psidium guajava]
MKKVKRKKKKNRDLSEGGQPSTKYDEPDQGEVHHMSLGIEDASEGMKSKTQKAGRKERKDRDFPEELGQLVKSNDNPDPGEVCPAASSRNGDTSKVTKKWVMEYYKKRPGIEILQQRIDDFINTHEVKLEQFSVSPTCIHIYHSCSAGKKRKRSPCCRGRMDCGNPSQRKEGRTQIVKVELLSALFPRLLWRISWLRRSERKLGQVSTDFKQEKRRGGV